MSLGRLASIHTYPIKGCHRIDHAATSVEPSGLAGDPPDPQALPSGCPFHPRCPDVMPHCSTAVPRLMPVGTSQLASCFLHHEEAEAT